MTIPMPEGGTLIVLALVIAAVFVVVRAFWRVVGKTGDEIVFYFVIKPMIDTFLRRR